MTVKESEAERNGQIGIIRMHAGTCFLPGRRLAVLVSPSRYENESICISPQASG